MYNTRQAAQQQQQIMHGVDENKRVDQKMAQKDMGNLVGAMSKGCNVKGDTQERVFGTNLSNTSHNHILHEAAKATGKAGEKVGDKWGNKGHRTSAARSAKDPSTTGLQSQVLSQSHQQPTSGTATVTSVGPAHSAIGSSASNNGPYPTAGRAKNAVTKAARVAAAAAKAAAAVAAKEKLAQQQLLQQRMSMTATLTTQAEESLGLEDAEMEDVADEHDDMCDIDSLDKGDQLAVADYIADIHAWYKKAEHYSIVPSDYMSTQTDINDKMRGILLDWLVEVHLKFKLMPETLYLTTNLIDRFLAVYGVTRKSLQLVGVTAMLLASKYEEIWAPEVKDFVYISDNAYTKDQILSMEKLMLNALKFNLSVPTPYVFATRFLKAAGADEEVQIVTWFLIELCLPAYAMLQFSPSHIAAAAVNTALRTLNRTPYWTATMQRHSGYNEPELRVCVALMIGLHQKASAGTLTAVHKKYSGQKFRGVAKLQPAVMPAEDGASKCSS